MKIRDFEVHKIKRKPHCHFVSHHEEKASLQNIPQNEKTGQQILFNEGFRIRIRIRSAFLKSLDPDPIFGVHPGSGSRSA